MGIKSDSRAIYRLQLNNIEELNKRLAKVFENSRDKAVSELMKLRESVSKGGIIKPFKEERLIKLISELSRDITLLTGKSLSMIRNQFKKTYAQTYYLSAYSIEKSVNTQLGLEASYSLNMPGLNEKAIIAAFDERVGGLIKSTVTRTKRITQEMQFRIQEAVGQNIAEGQTIRQLSKNLSNLDDVYNMGLNNATRIARTETLRSYSLSQDEARFEAEQSGVEFEYQWLATADQKTRITHIEKDGMPEDRMEGNDPVFNVGGVEFISPRAPLVPTGSSAEAAETINCRCRRLDLPFGIKPAKRAVKTKEGNWETKNADLTAKEWVKKEYDINI